MDERKASGEKSVAANDRDLGAMVLGKPLCGGLELGRPEIVGGRIDEVAAEIDRTREPHNRRKVEPFCQLEAGARRGVACPVSRKAIAAERKGEMGQRIGLGILGRIGELINPIGQLASELAGKEPRKRLAPARGPPEPQNGACKRAVGIGQHGNLARLGLPANAPEPAPLGVGEAVKHRLGRIEIDKPDGQRPHPRIGRQKNFLGARRFGHDIAIGLLLCVILCVVQVVHGTAARSIKGSAILPNASTFPSPPKAPAGPPRRPQGLT